MRACVVGLGAVGGLIAARIAAGGRAVSALARGATLEAVRANGLRLISEGRETVAQVNAHDSARALGVQDVVIVSVKTTSLAQVARSIGPLLGPDTVVVSAMNGIPWWFFTGLGERWRDTRLTACDADGAIGRAIAPSRVVGCVVHLAASCPQPGVVSHGFGSRLIVGEPGGAKSARLDAVAGLLRAGGFEVEASGSIEREVWLKLWGNMTMNPMSALTGATGDLLLDDPLARGFMSEAMLEASRIGHEIGIEVDMTPQQRHAVTRKLGALRTSMLQDVEAGRPLELDALVGAVSELGRVTGVATPVIDGLLGMTRVFARVRGLYPPA
ncbi:MAG: 2-dehydropantoate 2-reductase [Burkholderiaceae bacterium]|nr:2-dehydropantoate 2-reductase [Burkholderiaceae bacterium]